MKNLEKINFKISAWASILSAILIIPAAFLNIFVYANSDFSFMNSILNSILTISSVLILLGFLRLAKENNKKFLKKFSYISLTVLVLSFLTMFFKEFFSGNLLKLLGIASGITELIFNMSVLSLKKIYGRIIVSIGILNIIATIFYLSVILTFFGILISIPAYILQAIFFFRVSKKYESHLNNSFKKSKS